MKNPLSHYPLRISPILLYKLRVVAERDGRTKNKQIEMLIRNHVAAYEAEHGTIELPPSIEK